MTLTQRPNWSFDPGAARAALLQHFSITTLAGFGFDDEQPCVVAAGALRGPVAITGHMIATLPRVASVVFGGPA